MPDFSYRAIKPITVRAEQHGATVFCIFQCSITGELVNSFVGIETPGAPGADAAARSARAGLLWEVRCQLGSIFRDALGFGKPAPAGAAQGAERTAPHRLSEPELEDAVVRAFRVVSHRFTWDSVSQRWVSAAASQDLEADFDQQLLAAPLTEKYDQTICARMLATVAFADQELPEKESAFLAAFIDPELGSVQEVAARPAPSAEELAKTTPGPCRDTMLMLAWATALTDEKVAAAEVDRLAAFAQGLGVPQERAGQMKRYAQRYVLDRAIDSMGFGGQISEATQEEILAFAKEIGLDAAEVQQAIRLYQQRNALV